MDWKSKRVRAIIESALAEDKAANDVTTALTVPSPAAGDWDHHRQTGVHRLWAGLHTRLLRGVCEDVGYFAGALRSYLASGDLRWSAGQEGTGAGGDPPTTPPRSFRASV